MKIVNRAVQTSTLARARIAVLIGVVISTVFLAQSKADQRRFTYSYEPEVLPKGGLEFEQWITLRTQRSKDVGQDNYNLWEFREELEYGVTDKYSVSLYLNTQNESFRDPVTG